MKCIKKTYTLWNTATGKQIGEEYFSLFEANVDYNRWTAKGYKVSVRSCEIFESEGEMKHPKSDEKSIHKFKGGKKK